MRDKSSHPDEIACRRVVQALIAQYDWALPREDDLMEWILASIQAEDSPTDLERVAYSTALYEACRQTQDLDRRERGYRELFRFLFRVAYNRWPELAEDATQRALVLVYEQMDHCRGPGTFLGFAFFKLLQGFTEERRAMPLDGPLPEGLPAPFLSGLDQQEPLKILVEAIKRLPDQREQQVILLKFLGGLSDETIGARLQITPGHVRVLRHRGIARLREDKRLRDYFSGEGNEEIEGKL